MQVVNTKLDEALDYPKDIKNGLRDDIVRLERIVDLVEDDVNKVEDNVREQIDLADQRFENKRDQLLTDYEQKADNQEQVNQSKLKELEKVDLTKDYKEHWRTVSTKLGLIVTVFTIYIMLSNRKFIKRSNLLTQ